MGKGNPNSDDGEYSGEEAQNPRTFERSVKNVKTPKKFRFVCHFNW